MNIPLLGLLKTTKFLVQDGGDTVEFLALMQAHLLGINMQKSIVVGLLPKKSDETKTAANHTGGEGIMKSLNK